MGYMRDFLFQPEQARTPIGKLSGGERGRLMLARALAKPSNLIVLDEPTNDLDIETLDLLQELLGDYSGTILIVSHDRDFLDRVATSVIVGDGRRALGRICRRLFRYGGAARLWSCRSAWLPRFRQRRRRTDSRPKRAAPKRKMGIKEKRALETLPRRIEKLRADLGELERKLADADFPGPSAGCVRVRDQGLCWIARRAGAGPRTSGWDWRCSARSSSSSRTAQFENCRPSNRSRNSIASRVERITARDWAMESSISTTGVEED